jgi:transketolase
MQRLDQLCVNTIRCLAVDEVEQAKSGHPGLPLGAAPMAYVLWNRFLRHNPADPAWFNRDRFILSAGHGSALLYALLHLTGYDLPLEELKRFRQWGSKTPGHPEYGHTPGVETTTGPLGQGFATGVGMAIAEAHLAARFNRPGFDVVDHYTYALVSDGDLMEGISSEAASLAGHLGLGKLVYLYDNNHISIEGSTDLAFTEDVGARFLAYGWHVQRVEDGNDLEAIAAAIAAARAEADRPSLILVHTHIGFGSPKQDSASAHGEPLGPEAAKATHAAFGWPPDELFHVPEEAEAHLRLARVRGARLEGEWTSLVEAYRKAHPDLAAQFEEALAGRLPERWEMEVPLFRPGDGPIATRNASGKVLNALAKRVPTLIGGSADLAPSTKTLLAGSGAFSASDRTGRNFHFGIREHAMAAALNGMALHGGVIPYGSSFLIFSDYCRPAIRLSALMQAHVIYVFTHDSIAVGEDGPTHEPIEQLMSLRLIPGLLVLRPADANETAAAWRTALTWKGPVLMALSRQNLPILDPDVYPVGQGFSHGAYVLEEASGGDPEIVLVASGSEVHLILEAKQRLQAEGVRARAVSMPSWELFDGQPEEYRKAVLPPGVPKVAVEAGSPRGWRDYVGTEGEVIGLDRFGASAPGSLVMEKLGFTVDNVLAHCRALLKS